MTREHARPRTAADAAPGRILIMAPSWVGDVVMATPAFRALRRRFADAEITLAIRRNPRPVIDDAPWFDRVIEIDERGRTLFGTFRLARRLRDEAFDLGVLLVNSFRSALVMRLARVRRVVGYRRDGRAWLLSGGPTPPREGRRFVPVSALDYYLELARHLGADVSDRRMALFYGDRVARAFDDFARRCGIDTTRRLVVLNPGASFGSSKCWPVEHFARTAEALAADDVQVVVICGPAERELAQAVAREAGCEVVSLHGEPAGLDLLKVLIDRATLLITNDTGPRHYAAAFDTPVVTVFGSTDPRWSDTGFERERIVRIDVECAPCQRKTCPVDHRCMRLLKPELVIGAARELMNRVPRNVEQPCASG
jgi:heptosyltransferase-2